MCGMKLPTRHRVDQLLRIWLPLAIEEFVDWNALNKRTVLHDDHTIGDLQHHAKVMRDQENGDATLFAQRS